jgi:hypothetical protein
MFFEKRLVSCSEVAALAAKTFEFTNRQHDCDRLAASCEFDFASRLDLIDDRRELQASLGMEYRCVILPMYIVTPMATASAQAIPRLLGRHRRGRRSQETWVRDWVQLDGH